MSRLLLIHWNAREAAERAARLRAAGHRVSVHADPDSVLSLRKIRDTPPQLFVIDLGRLPSHGRAVGSWVRQQKATRRLPVVFVCDDPARLDQARQQLPDASFTDWRKIRGAITRALKNPPQDPVVPGTMDGYSGVPLARKLGIKEGTTVALLGAPPGFDRTLGALPSGVRLRNSARGRAERLLLFVRSQAELSRRFDAAVRGMAPGGGLWIAWPKQSSGEATDLTQTIVRRVGLDAGLVDYKICAIDATWSGLLFARRAERARKR